MLTCSQSNSVSFDNFVKNSSFPSIHLVILANVARTVRVFDFASSNELWRATVEILDFVPLTNASYSGGIIITDWFSGSTEDSKRNLKITIKFLSNEIRSDSIKVDVHERICSSQNNCRTSLVKSKISNEIKVAILKKAAFMEKSKVEEKIKSKKKKGVTIDDLDFD